MKISIQIWRNLSHTPETTHLIFKEPIIGYLNNLLNTLHEIP